MTKKSYQETGYGKLENGSSMTVIASAAHNLDDVILRIPSRSVDVAHS